MAKRSKGLPADYSARPWLSRMFRGIDSPESGNRIFWILVAICVGLFFADLTYDKYGHFEVEKRIGFYGVVGFIVFGFIILASSALRREISRPEDYYGDKSVDSEDYPKDQLEVKDIDV